MSINVQKTMRDVLVCFSVSLKMSARIFSWQPAHWTHWCIVCGGCWQVCSCHPVCLDHGLAVVSHFWSVTQALHKKYILMGLIRVQRSEVGLHVRCCSEPCTRWYPKLNHDCFVIHFSMLLITNCVTIRSDTVWAPDSFIVSTIHEEKGKSLLCLRRISTHRAVWHFFVLATELHVFECLLVPVLQRYKAMQIVLNQHSGITL